MGFKKATQLFVTIIVGCLMGVQFMPVAVTFVQTSFVMLKSPT